MSKHLDCLGLGISPLDILVGIGNYPPVGSKIDGTGLTIQGGGPVPNAMVALSRLGMKTAVIIPVGDDLFGQLLVEELKREGISVSYVVRKKQPTALATGWIERGSGSRTIVLNRQINLTPGDIKLRDLPATRMVHLDGRDIAACLKLANWAGREKITVSFDIGSIRNDISAILPLTDHLVCADAFALPYTGSSEPRTAIEKLKGICPGTIVVTSGTNGSIGYDKISGYVRQRAFKVKSIDTTGAGDTFHGGYLFGLLKGWDLKKRLRFASAAAAIKCTRPGARTGIPNYRQVISFLNRSGGRYA
nr:hypothetical protein [candidate division Zixibacteria bacterium]